EAEQVGNLFQRTRWIGDNPTKLQHDIQEARLHAASNPIVSNPMAAATNNTEAARRLIQQGRQALQVHDAGRARQFADQAAALKPDLNWNEDNPEKLLADVIRFDPAQA